MSRYLQFKANSMHQADRFRIPAPDQPLDEFYIEALPLCAHCGRPNEITVAVVEIPDEVTPGKSPDALEYVPPYHSPKELAEWLYSDGDTFRWLVHNIAVELARVRTAHGDLERIP